MATFKMIMSFDGSNYKGPIGGWSEVYYQLGSTPDDAQTTLMTLANQRLAVLMPNYRLSYTRVADVDNPGVASVKGRFLAGTYQGPSKGLSGSTGQLWVASHVTLYADGGRPSRKLMMRGIPAEVSALLTAEEDVTVRTQWLTSQALYLGGLAAQKYLIKSRLKATQPPTYKILSVTFQGPQVALVLKTVQGLNQGDRVHLYNLRAFEGLSGDRVLNSVTQATNTVTVSAFNAEDGEYQGNGYLQPISYVYTPIKTFDASAITHRDTGRPFGLQRGRRRNPTI
jgi:hypothetical protein